MIAVLGDDAVATTGAFEQSRKPGDLRVATIVNLGVLVQPRLTAEKKLRGDNPFVGGEG